MLYNIIHENSTRSVIVALMNFFTRFQVEKYGNAVLNSGADTYVSRKVINVPVQWAARDKWLELYRSSSSRRIMDPAIRDVNPVEMQWILPRISFNLLSMNYDSVRRLSKTQQISTPADITSVAPSIGSMYTPAPWNIDIEVNIITKTLDDQFQLMEQIVPFFSPSLSLNVRLFSDKPADSVPYLLSGVHPNIPVDISETEERLYVFTYSFTAKLNYYMNKSSAVPSSAVICITGTTSPTTDIGVIGDFYLEAGIVNTPTASAATTVGQIFQRNTDAWKIVYSAPSSGIWNLGSGPTSADNLYDALGNPISGSWTSGTTDPVTAAQLDNVYYFNTSNGTVLRRTWTWSPAGSGLTYGASGLTANAYYNSTTSATFIQTFSYTVIQSGLSTGYRPILNTTSNIHMYTDYVQISDEWSQTQQKVLQQFNYYVNAANEPNPYFTGTNISNGVI